MAIFGDDSEPRPKIVHQLGEDLDRFSVAELDQRVILLEAEILRLKAEKLKKQSLRSAADDFFKKM